MKIYSDEQTRANNEPTWLAIAETVIATLIAIHLAVHWGSLWPYAVSVVVAPLLLLRSEESARKGKQWFDGLQGRLLVAFRKRSLTRFDEWRQSTQFLLSVLGLFLLLLLESVVPVFLTGAAFAIRVVATLLFIRKGVRELPKNWRRVVLATDICTPVEYVPDAGSVSRVHLRLSLMPGWKYGLLIISLVVFGCIVALVQWLFSLPPVQWSDVWYSSPVFVFFYFGAIAFVAPLLYRLSLKSTALLWLPLIYVVGRTFDSKASVATLLRDRRESGLSRILRIVSWGSLALLFYKFAILPHVADWWNALPAAEFFDIFLMPDTIHPWHVAIGLNAVIALAAYYCYFERAHRYLESGEWTEEQVRRWDIRLLWVHLAISSYTIATGIYLLWEAAWDMPWPHFSFDPFPW